MIFYYNANKTNFHNKGFALGFVLRVRVFGTQKWPISFQGLESNGIRVWFMEND